MNFWLCFPELSPSPLQRYIATYLVHWRVGDAVPHISRDGVFTLDHHGETCKFERRTLELRKRTPDYHSVGLASPASFSSPSSVCLTLFFFLFPSGFAHTACHSILIIVFLDVVHPSATSKLMTTPIDYSTHCCLKIVSAHFYTFQSAYSYPVHPVLSAYSVCAFLFGLPILPTHCCVHIRSVDSVCVTHQHVTSWASCPLARPWKSGQRDRARASIVQEQET